MGGRFGRVGGTALASTVRDVVLIIFIHRQLMRQAAGDMFDLN
jgi:hypothetical protein